MRKSILTAMPLAAVMALAAGTAPRAAADPMALPAHFVPVEADLALCTLLPEMEYPNWEFDEYYVDGEYISAFGCYAEWMEPNDDWLILPQLATAAGGTVSVNYSHATSAPMNYTLCWGTSPEPSAMTNVVKEFTGLDTYRSAEAVEGQFEAPAGKNVYVGFHVTTPQGNDQVNLKVWDITVAAASSDYPADPEFEIVMNGIEGKAYVTFPTLTAAGEQITAGKMTATIVIDGKADMTYTLEGAPGADATADVTLPVGDHTAVCTVSFEADGQTFTSKPVTQMFTVEIPDDYVLDLPLSFTPSATNYGMLKILDVNGDGKTWEVMETFPDELRIKENYKMAADDWAILPAVNVTAAGKYRFTIRAAVQAASCPESVELCLGKSPEPAAMTTSVIRLEDFRDTRADDGSLPLFEGTLTVDAPGKYYLGIHGFSQKDMLTLSVGTVTMEKSRFDYLDPAAYAALPADMYQIEVQEACQDGVRYNVKAQEQIMVYTNAIFDETYVTEDNLTDEDFAEQILYISNYALETFGSWEGAQQAEFFYTGDKNIENAIVNAPGTRAFVAVMGLLYDEATNTVTPLTKLCRSEVFEYTADRFSQEEAWAEMKNPVYMESKGKKVVRVDIELNATAEEAYGKGFAHDHRDHNSDYEIIQYLTSVSNMPETLIYPMHLDAPLEPGEKSLMAVTTTDRNGKPSKKLNWMLVQAPAELGQPVTVLATATDGLGIEGITAAPAADGSAEYFSVSGRAIPAGNLTPGVYLRLSGGKVTKVIVR